jgi:hypothetical protein
MSEEAQIVPEVPFGLAELRGIERVLWGYGKYFGARAWRRRTRGAFKRWRAYAGGWMRN